MPQSSPAKTCSIHQSSKHQSI